MKNNDAIRIAVTYENGEIFQHFGQTTQFKIYDTRGGEIIAAEVVGTNGVTHCSLGSYLYENNVNVLICGNLGAGASKSLQAAGILVYGGNQGSADEAVAKLLRKELIYNPAPTCSEEHHHDHGAAIIMMKTVVADIIIIRAVIIIKMKKMPDIIIVPGMTDKRRKSTA